MQKNMVYKEHAEGEFGVGNGGQELVLRRDPLGAWNESTDRPLGMFLGELEWSALFREVLRCPEGTSFKPGEILDEWKNKHRTQFQESIPDFPMLARIWDTYIDVHYQSEEISQLRDECLRVKSSTSNPTAISGLDKLIAASERAMEHRLGLSLLSE